MLSFFPFARAEVDEPAAEQPAALTATAVTPGSMPTPLQVLREVFGYPQFRPGQQAIVEQVVAGHDGLVIVPTGGGKSLCYRDPGTGAPRPRCGGVAADCADEGSGRRAACQRRGGAGLHSGLSREV